MPFIESFLSDLLSSGWNGFDGIDDVITCISNLPFRVNMESFQINILDPLKRLYWTSNVFQKVFSCLFVSFFLYFVCFVCL